VAITASFWAGPSSRSFKQDIKSRDRFFFDRFRPFRCFGSITRGHRWFWWDRWFSWWRPSLSDRDGDFAPRLPRVIPSKTGKPSLLLLPRTVPSSSRRNSSDHSIGSEFRRTPHSSTSSSSSSSHLLLQCLRRLLLSRFPPQSQQRKHHRGERCPIHCIDGVTRFVRSNRIDETKNVGCEGADGPGGIVDPVE